jgi:hypothetical protein
MVFLQNKDLPEDLDHPHQIDPNDVGSDAEMVDDAHDDREVDVDADDHDHDGDDDEAVASSSQCHS